MNINRGKEKASGQETILLMLTPFMTKLIPPMGISCLKSFLQHHGCKVKALDANLKEEFEEIYNRYFDTLRGYIPESNQGNFYSIGHDVLRNHMMAHFSRNYADSRDQGEDKKQYIEVVKVVVAKTFFCTLNDEQADELIEIVADFFSGFENYFLEIMEEVKPMVVGLSVFSDTLPLSLAAFKWTKSISPQTKTVMGGGVFADQLDVGSPDFRVFLEKTASYIDKIIVGEGEELFLKLLEGELPENQRVFTREDLNWKVLDLSTVDIPDFSDLDVRYYPYMGTYTSRSCPFQCSFCSETVNWGPYRKKNAKQCADELIRVYEKHKSQLFLIADSLLNPILTDLSQELLQRETSIYFDGYLRVDKEVCNPDNTFLWRRGGFYRARLGIESGSPRVLELMNKKITLQQIKDAVANLAYAGIKTTTYWIMGHPGESEEDFQQSLALVEELKENLYEAECRPFYYYLTGQVSSDDWMGEYQRIPLYPQEMVDQLMLQTWSIDCEPTREVAYQRVSHFIEFCRKLGIPNPYSLIDIYKADVRWKNLQKNAVPPLMLFKDPEQYIDENKHLKPTLLAEDSHQEEVDFNF
jgi:radical SAM superfamily enzyme YgiQ (UPF0313 family)